MRVDERASKMEALISGEVDAIQIYDTTEAIELECLLGKPPGITMLTSLVPPGSPQGTSIPLGFGQCLFAARSALRRPAVRRALALFVEATEEGWRTCAEDLELATDIVIKMRASFGYGKGPKLAMDDTHDFQKKSLERCLKLVSGGRGHTPKDLAGRLCAVDPSAWQAASEAMSRIGYCPTATPIPLSMSFDDSVWPCLGQATAAAAGTANTQTKKKRSRGAEECIVPDGYELTRNVMAQVKARALALVRRGAPHAPTLAILRSAPAPSSAHHSRLGAFAPPGGAPAGGWFGKIQGMSDETGIAIKEVILPQGASFGQAYAMIEKLNADEGVDAILVERPLNGLNADSLGLAIVPSKDVDGEHAASLTGSRGAAGLSTFDSIWNDEPSTGARSSAAPPPWISQEPLVIPFFVQSALHILDSHPVPKGASCVVIGRSRKIGLPLSLALIARDLTVTVCNSQTPEAALKTACSNADVIFAGAGIPGMVTKSMIKPGAIVINLGTTFIAAKDGSPAQLLPDADVSCKDVASVYTPTPGGMGPTTVAFLGLNAITLAETKERVRSAKLRHKAAEQKGPLGSLEELTSAAKARGWSVGKCSTTGHEHLAKDFAFGDFSAAVDAVVRVRNLSERANHHPTLVINGARKCEQEEGCKVSVQLSTYSEGKITASDGAAALAIDDLLVSVA